MKKIIAINASPRTTMNTATLVQEAAKGAMSQGATVKVVDLYKLDHFTGCMSCFGCKLQEHVGVCIYKDGLTSLLEEIRQADGLIIGTPNYLGDVSAGFRAFYERLVFQSITYQKEQKTYNHHLIPVLFIMTSNVSEEAYDKIGYDKIVSRYINTLNTHVGPTKTLICGDTLQVKDYSRYHWTIFDPEAKRLRHEAIFPSEKEKAFSLGIDMVCQSWK